MIILRKIKLVFAFFVFSLVLVAGINLLHSSVAYAYPSSCTNSSGAIIVTFCASDVPSSIRWDMYNYDNFKDTGQQCLNGQDYLNEEWISPTNNTADNTSQTVPYGTTSEPLMLNDLLMVCNTKVIGQPKYPQPPADLAGPPTGSTTSCPLTYNGCPSTNVLVYQLMQVSNIQVTSGGGSISGVYPTLPNSVYNKYNPGTRFWFGAPTSFTYNAPAGGLKNSTTIQITATVQLINNYYHDYYYNNSYHPTNQYICVAAPVNSYPSLAGAQANCSTTNLYYTFTFIVPQQPTIGVVESYQCTTANNPYSITGWAFDPNNSSASIFVDIINSTTGSVKAVLANIYRPDVNNAYSITGNHGFVVNLSGDQGFNSNTYTVWAMSSSGNPAYNSQLNYYVDPPQINTFTIGPCDTLTLACGTANPTSAALSQNFSLSTNVTNDITTSSGSPPSLSTGTYDVTFNGNTYSGFSSSGNTLTSNPISTTINTPGIYPINWSFTFNGISINCQSSISVYIAPYLKVYNGDVVVGSNFDTSSSQCSQGLPHSIYAWNNNSYSGSGSNLGVLATGNIFGFASNQGANGSPPFNLTFANDHSTLANNVSWGGNLNQVPCIYDYWDAMPANTYKVPATSSNDIQINQGHCLNNLSNPLTDCIAKYSTGSGGSTPQINQAGIKIYQGQHATIYVDGNVYINGNVQLMSWISGSSIQNIPSFTLIAKGNIYISPNVTELDGTYIAQGGTIYTCSNNGATPNPLYSSCSNNQLKIYGSLIAKQIDFMRTNGTVSQAANPSSNLCSGADPNAAEVICYTPNEWLGQSGSNNYYNEISSPPPIL